MTAFTFHRSERLKSRKQIEALFRQGRSFGKFPLRIVYLPSQVDIPCPAQFALSVPKKKFRRAVDRNRLRRQIREAYRLHKHELYATLDQRGIKLAMMFIYTAHEKMPFDQIEKAMIQIIRRLERELPPSSIDS